MLNHHKLLSLSVLTPISLVIALTGCGGKNQKDTFEELDPIEKEETLQEQFEKSVVGVTGRIVDQNGQIIENATISFVGDEPASVFSDSSGEFTFTDLTRKNRLLEVKAEGYRSEYIAVNSLAPMKTETISLDQIILTAKLTQETRFLFGGDTAFGRRFIDTDESTPPGQIPPDDPTALIKASDPLPGTKDAVQWIRPHYQEADWGVLNLETPVTDNPLTPHPDKAYVFFTFEKSLQALKWLGVDYVSLGNNHLYDYLEQGTIDTIYNVNVNGIEHSGSGLNSEEALAARRLTINGEDYAFFSATSVTGNKHADNYVATATKGGGGDLTDNDGVANSLKKEAEAGYIPIAQLHTGKEYTYEPTSYVLNRMELVVDSGAELTIAHHPHVAQGVGLVDNKVVVHGLGNLAFDQDRQETLMGLMARVDMQGKDVKQVRMLPVYIEDYRPRLITGTLANNFLRRIGEFSSNYGATVYPYLGQGWVSFNDDDVELVEHSETIEVTIPASGSTIVDLREMATSEYSVGKVSADKSIELSLGRDLMLYGDFDDWDTDEEQMEAVRWDLSSDSKYSCLDAYKGVSALCTSRKASDSSDAVVAYRNRIRVMGDALDNPIKDLSLFGYVKADNAGPISIISRYYASAGDLIFGEEEAFSHQGGSFDWQAFSAKLSMPEDSAVDEELSLGEVNARALRVFIRHSAPGDNEGVATFDELAVISWENFVSLDTDIQIPHAKNFLRITGQPGLVNLSVKFQKYQPK